MHLYVHNKSLDFENRTTMEHNNIFNKTTVYIHIKSVFSCAGCDTLYSHHEDCCMNECPFKDLFDQWKMHKLSKKQRNAYLILCKNFGLPSSVIKIIEDNHEDNGVRLGDALHRICHKNPNITREEVIEIITNDIAK